MRLLCLVAQSALLASASNNPVVVDSDRETVVLKAQPNITGNSADVARDSDPANTGPTPANTTATTVLRGSVSGGPSVTHEDRNCSWAEVAVWRNNQDFSTSLNVVAIRNIGIAKLIAPELGALYPTLTSRCLACFTDQVWCGATECFSACLGRTLSHGCLSCCEQKCNPALKACLQVEQEDMPLVPLEPAAERKVGPIRVRTKPSLTESTTTTSLALADESDSLIIHKEGAKESLSVPAAEQPTTAWPSWPTWSVRGLVFVSIIATVWASLIKS